MEESANTPTSTQEFCLRWNNFHASLVSAFDGFKNDSDFVDVTLACEGQFIKAHKMLLSACSAFFRDLLKANPCQHPIVILPPEVKFLDLERLMRFIYQGEVNVLQDHLPRFLKTAEMLKIRGLAEEKEKKKILECPSPKNCDSGSERSSDNVSVIPKRPRLSTDGVSGSSLLPGGGGGDLHLHPHQQQRPRTPAAVGEDGGSGPESDSEMIPVKQEMIEFKECDFESVECESFFSDGFIKINSSIAASSSCGAAPDNTATSTHQVAPPPPPGALLPSYVPPMQIKAPDGHSRSSSQPVGGLIRRFLAECLQLPDPTPLLTTYSGLETTPHFQLLRSVAKEWSYCRNATQNYSSFGGNNKRQRASSRLIETFESIDNLRNQLAQILHAIIVMEVSSAGTVQKICKAEHAYVQQQQLAQQQAVQSGSDNIMHVDVINRDYVMLDIEGVSNSQQEEFKKATAVMKQLRKLYFDQSRRLAVRISQLKKGRQHSNERVQRHSYQQQQQQMQQGYTQQNQSQQMQQQQSHNVQSQSNNSQMHHQHNNLSQHQSLQQHQQQPMQHQIQINPDGSLHLPHHSQLSLHPSLHQPWSD